MIRVTVSKNDFAKIAAKLDFAADAVVAETAYDVEAGAKQRSRVATGTMRRGWKWRSTGRHAATISNPVPYAIYNEYGTHKMPAQPMVTPAVESARPKFLARLALIFKI